MAKRPLNEQLDLAVEALMAERGSGPSDLDSRVAALLEVAGQLRDLPREEFRNRLKEDLARAGVANRRRPAAASSQREGFHTLTPYLPVHQAPELIDFIKNAFGGEELMRTAGSAGGLHSELRIRDSMLMVGGGVAGKGGAMPTTLHLYVEDADRVYERALAHGARSLDPPTDQPYGDREAGIEDLSGNRWYIATHKETGLAPPGLLAVTPYLHAHGAPQLIDFFQRAFGAKEVARYLSPQGQVIHAKVRIGDSILEMGEARGKYQPMPTTFYVYVQDVDASYQRAVGEGAVSLTPPADQDYGDRVASVRDPAGNLWYLATHVESGRK
jgi:PhnB protein